MYYHDSLPHVADFLRKISTDDMEDVLQDFLTPQEIVVLAERIELFKQLKAGKTQREIANDMGISVTTVSRGNRVLQYGTGKIGKYVT
ncbi:MAG: trp operon repressor [Candidatus Absconditabacterales bacterium]|nr:trp operon repressor [Candidatus Absconditabacterales bacterium]